MIRTQVPDPFVPTVGTRLSATPLPGAGDCAAQQRRRAEILAATRRLLALEGHDRFTLRAISDASGVTTQTIHNSFGCKNDLLRAALNQHTAMIDSHALSQSREPIVFLLLALAYCQSAIDYPAFLRQFMLTHMQPDGATRRALFAFGTELKLQILKDIGRRELLRSCVDPRIAAEQIASVNTVAMQEWAESGDFDRLYQRLVHGNANILMGILIPDLARGIEQWLMETGPGTHLRRTA